MIPLHIPYYHQPEATLLNKLVQGTNDPYPELDKYMHQHGFGQVYFTKSCTHALETVALLLELKKGDEVIVPSYTYVTTANAFALFGAKIVFADSRNDSPNTGLEQLEKCITRKTRVIVVTHYAGMGLTDIKKIAKICKQKKIFLVEDAAHCIGAKLDGQPLGTFGHASTFSFHESKNITCVEGGMLVINHKPWIKRTQNILYKGTNRIAFDQKKTSVYEWVDLGSSYRMDSLHANLLAAQLPLTEKINSHRCKLHALYTKLLSELRSDGKLKFHSPDQTQTHNGHIFWIELNDGKTRNALTKFLHAKGIYATFHYLALHKSPYGKKMHNNKVLPNAERYEKTLLRLPLFYQLTEKEVEFICKTIESFFRNLPGK